MVYERQSLTCVNLQDKQHNFFLSFLLHTAKQDRELIRNTCSLTYIKAFWTCDPNMIMATHRGSGGEYSGFFYIPSIHRLGHYLGVQNFDLQYFGEFIAK